MSWKITISIHMQKNGHSQAVLRMLKKKPPGGNPTSALPSTPFKARLIQGRNDLANILRNFSWPVTMVVIVLKTRTKWSQIFPIRMNYVKRWNRINIFMLYNLFTWSIYHYEQDACSSDIKARLPFRQMIKYPVWSGCGGLADKATVNLKLNKILKWYEFRYCPVSSSLWPFLER